ncbi:hypothetical protein [Roseovarius sp. D22-M7]|uniref:hypothetical protein n=1 Tax=Roseovarius sp. D22-M7 TaxID=3127116 RepID=UPI00300FCB6F
MVPSSGRAIRIATAVTNPGDRAENVESARRFWAFLQKREQRALQLGDLTFELHDPRFGLTFGQSHGPCLKADQQALALLDQGSARALQFLENGLIFIANRIRQKIERRSHHGQNARITGIGPCSGAAGL